MLQLFYLSIQLAVIVAFGLIPFWAFQSWTIVSQTVTRTAYGQDVTASLDLYLGPVHDATRTRTRYTRLSICVPCAADHLLR